MIKQYGCFKLAHFSKNWVFCSPAGPEILAFVSHYSANFQPNLYCFIPNFKLKYEDSENIKLDLVNTVIFNLHQVKRWASFFWDARYNEVVMVDEALQSCKTAHLVEGTRIINPTTQGVNRAEGWMAAVL